MVVLGELMGNPIVYGGRLSGDADNAKMPRYYTVRDPNYDNQNIPIKYGTIIVYGSDTDYITQLAIDISGNRLSRGFNGTVWSEWI